MNFALDYDGTYTEDPFLFDSFIENAIDSGHHVYLVTMRKPEEANQQLKRLNIPVIFTSRKAKKPFVESLGINIDVWIDDNPQWVLIDSQ